MRNIRARRVRTATAAVTVAFLLPLTACSGGSDNGNSKSGGKNLPALAMNGSETIADGDASGLDVSKKLFDSADQLVVADRTHVKAASEAAISNKAPLVVATGSNGQAISDEAHRLKAKKVTTFGDVGDIPNLGDIKSEGQAGDADAGDVVGDVVKHGAADPKKKLPPVFVTAETSPAAIANAKAAGADVRQLSYPDPRVDNDTANVAKSQDTLALGGQFGTSDRYKGAVSMIDNGEQPGGGRLLFPGRRMVAAYGETSGPALGILGASDPQGSVKWIKDRAAEYQGMTDEPVIPSFEIIATVASSEPGPSNTYSSEIEAKSLEPWIDAITQAGGYAFIDLQPGRASLLDQAKRYQSLLEKPNVGLALDPEWHIGPDEKPLQRVGSSEAHELDEVSDWLAGIVRDKKLPQKAFVVHQFQLQMIRHRETMNLDHPELAYVLHADGNGTTEQKFETWNVMRQELDPRWFMAWKNFLKEDKPTFTPEQTYNMVNPRPWLVTYQ